jgi:hypothetical protein
MTAIGAATYMERLREELVRQGFPFLSVVAAPPHAAQRQGSHMEQDFNWIDAEIYAEFVQNAIISVRHTPGIEHYDSVYFSITEDRRAGTMRGELRIFHS